MDYLDEDDEYGFDFRRLELEGEIEEILLACISQLKNESNLDSSSENSIYYWNEYSPTDKNNEKLILYNRGLVVQAKNQKEAKFIFSLLFIFLRLLVKPYDKNGYNGFLYN